jgi:hypothetical protein
MVTNIQSIEADGEYWVSIRMDGETNRYGPYPDVGTAEAMAGRFTAICRSLFSRQSADTSRSASRRAHAGSPASASRLIMEI